MYYFEEVEEFRNQIKTLNREHSLQIEKLSKENIRLRKKNGKLLRKIKMLKDNNNQRDNFNINLFKKKLKEKTQECENIEKTLKVIFTSGQINKMKTTSKVHT
ncbi:uncharacterized protein LOC126766694 [Bactrocera neohumeralis]|uniref:uncharacterized protein LOC126766694 n=1 Tax=Bactrocera neohumeralis TaxID=98809 RepID=UPI002165F16A|nr:uncharacterized protein LOC126766694 [Bactrocera neohumeralis]